MILHEQARRSREERLTTSQLEATKHNSEFLRTLSPLLEQQDVAFVGVFAKDGHAIAKSPLLHAGDKNPTMSV